MASGPVPVAATDRRHRRRLETIEEILDIAVQIMAELGVAGLSVGEIARRMGIRPPSVYVYFPSKHALYDALFARGARLLLAAMQEAFAAMATRQATLEEILLPASRAFVRWSVEHAAYSQLLFWRPVPGFAPIRCPSGHWLTGPIEFLTGDSRDERHPANGAVAASATSADLTASHDGHAGRARPAAQEFPWRAAAGTCPHERRSRLLSGATRPPMDHRTAPTP